MNMKEKLMRFMYGRYGVDSLGKCLLGIGIASAAATWFSDARIFPLLAWVCIIYTYFRMFSKNIYKRSAENRAYLAKTYKLRCFFARQKNMFVQRKTHHIYKCPSCKQKIRIPRGKGRIEIRCPKCSTTFIKNS
jgi:DNA-directed RNA polymerase subunit RPC12/RpoP